MGCRRQRYALPARRHQGGIALFISLILLLMLTIIGVSSVQTTTLEMRMARNEHDRMLAFQAAESALRDAEAALASIEATTAFTDGGTDGLWTVAPMEQPDRWQLPGVWGDARSVAAATRVPVVTAQPRYLLEHVATLTADATPLQLDDPNTLHAVAVFRATARGVGGSAESVSMLQSTFGQAMTGPTPAVDALAARRAAAAEAARASLLAYVGAAAAADLGPLTVVDVDGDGAADRLYGGDRFGKLTRFTRQGEGWAATVLFTPRVDGIAAPISVAPVVAARPLEEGVLVVFAAGDPLAEAPTPHSVYGVWDRGDANLPTAQSRASSGARSGARSPGLVQQTMAEILDDAGRVRRVLSSQPVAYQVDGSMVDAYGWYVDLPTPLSDTSSGRPAVAERIAGLWLRNGAVIAATELPNDAGDSVLASLTVLDLATGGAPRRAVLDVDGDARIGPGDLLRVDDELQGAGVALAHMAVSSEVRLAPGGVALVAGGTDEVAWTLAEPLELRQGRLSWREFDSLP